MQESFGGENFQSHMETWTISKATFAKVAILKLSSFHLSGKGSWGESIPFSWHSESINSVNVWFNQVLQVCFYLGKYLGGYWFVLFHCTERQKC